MGQYNILSDLILGWLEVGMEIHLSLASSLAVNNANLKIRHIPLDQSLSLSKCAFDHCLCLSKMSRSIPLSL